MKLPRVVAPETLDGLAEDDPQAMRSRRDLLRVHLAMGTRGIMRRALAGLRMPSTDAGPLQLLELGAGDGRLMLGVAQALNALWPRVEITLLDRQELVTPATLAAYGRLGWSAAVEVVDVLDWASASSSSASSTTPDPHAHWDVVVANLFVHHFEGIQLANLLAAIETRTDCFFACEPRRARLALAGSHLIGAIGANAVTREDAVLSVHAGFQGQEISALWPGQSGRWNLKEYSAGLFSHCFSAERNLPGAAVAS